VAERPRPTKPVELTMALCMEWNNPAINTLELAPL
jgi:hypothetical protein